MENQEKAYDKKKKHLLIIGGLILFNLITYNLFVKTGGYDSSGQYIPYDQAKALKSSLITFFIGLPFISFFLGLLVAIFPFKKLPYSKKYLRASLLTMLTINGLFSFGLVCIIAMTAMGWYPAPQQDNFVDNQESKEQGVQKFKNEIKVLCDSSNYYFDWGLDALENGQEPNEIGEKISPKLKNFESQLDAKTREFQKNASDLRLTENEYQKVFDDLSEYIEPMTEKHRQLREKGVKIE
jgi:hypothetical protein